MTDRLSLTFTVFFSLLIGRPPIKTIEQVLLEVSSIVDPLLTFNFVEGLSSESAVSNASSRTHGKGPIQIYIHVLMLKNSFFPLRVRGGR
jgi:hypothetical protein